MSAVMELSFTCPKRKCRHAWNDRSDIVINADCPQCGTKDLSPVDIERTQDA